MGLITPLCKTVVMLGCLYCFNKAASRDFLTLTLGRVVSGRVNMAVLSRF